MPSSASNEDTRPGGDTSPGREKIPIITDAVLETIQMTPAAVRKLARLTSLHPDSIVEIAQTESGEAWQVEFLDEYGSHVRGPHGIKAGHLVVIRENGWSNPSFLRARVALQ
jgi:hypothetical protein